MVTYLHILDVRGMATTSLMMAKSRLAPIKPLSIPRLELQAANLATEQDSLLKWEMGVNLGKS